jgi:hypothetical protein
VIGCFGPVLVTYHMKQTCDKIAGHVDLHALHYSRQHLDIAELATFLQPWDCWPISDSLGKYEDGVHQSTVVKSTEHVIFCETKLLYCCISDTNMKSVNESMSDKSLLAYQI